MAGFFRFIREQGVVGLAIGFIMGGSIAKVVSSLVTDIVQPLLGLLLGSAKGLAEASFKILGAEIKYGSFLTALIDFMVVALVVYLGFIIFKPEKLNPAKEGQK